MAFIKYFLELAFHNQCVNKQLDFFEFAGVVYVANDNSLINFTEI